jgi:hypothetical protein
MSASRKRASGIPTFRCADTAKVVGRRDLAHDLTIRSIAHVVKYRPPEMRWESEPAGGPLTLSYELRPGGNRPGPADLWAQFNVAVDRLGASLAEGRAGVCGHGRASLGSDEPRHSSPHHPRACQQGMAGGGSAAAHAPVRPAIARSATSSPRPGLEADLHLAGQGDVRRPGIATAICSPAARRKPRRGSTQSCKCRKRLWRTPLKTHTPP